ncbi:MAG: flavodoxin domain-containing protein [Aeromicrobium sp.]
MRDHPYSVLVACATRHGATAGIAARIGDRLRETLASPQWEVSVVDSESIDSIGDHDAVVLGSAVYLGSWIKSARQLLNDLQSAPPLGLWLFSSGPVGDDAANAEHADTAPDVASELDVRDSIVFAGRIDFSELSRFERAVAKALRVDEGDYRDWEAVDAWALGIARDLLVTMNDPGQKGGPDGEKRDLLP